MNNCSQCFRNPHCQAVGTLCNMFELYTHLVEDQRKLLINKQTENTLKLYFARTIDQYLLLNSNNNFVMWYSLDQNKFIIRNAHSTRGVGNWIKVNIDLHQFIHLREVYNPTFINNTFYEFFNKWCYIPKEEKIIKTKPLF